MTALRPFIAVLALAVATLAAAACGGGEEGELSPANRAKAEQLLADLQSQDYHTFTRAPGWETPRQQGTTTHHGAYLDVYINDVLAQSVAGGGTAPWPVGSILIKDGWSDADGTMLFGIAAARKEAGGWFGAEYAPDGTVREAGLNFGECLGCHGDGDFVQSF